MSNIKSTLCAVSTVATMGLSSAVTPCAQADPVSGQACMDVDKLIYNSTTGKEMVCTPAGWGTAPDVTGGVHTTGSSCQSPGMEATSVDNYLILCEQGVWVHFRE